MSETSLKSQATKGMFWNAFEYFTTLGSQFVISVVLARLLLPSDFGLIGMLTVFIALSQVLVQSGMGTALVQKKNRTDIDFSTVFIFNFIVSISIYLLLFISAPFIAEFYGMPQLSLLTRILCLGIIIDSLSQVQNSRLLINLDFKTMAKINLTATTISGVGASVLAYFNFGVWALVFHNLARASLASIFLWYNNKSLPQMTFSKQSFRELFGFGSKLLGAGIIATVFSNIYKVVIGKVYTARVLGFYTQAFQFVDITAGSITSVLQKTTFPILASINNDEERMVEVYKKLLGMTSFVILPTMTLFALLAEPFVLVFLGEKWIETTPLLQWLCFARIIYPISTLNMNILNAKGRSDLFLKVDLSKLPITVIALIITIPLGIKAVVIGHVVTSFISFFINAYMPGQLFGYGIISQIKDMLPKIIAVLIMSLCIYYILSFIQTPFFKLLWGSVIGILIYFILSITFKVPEILEVNYLLKKIVKK